MTYPINNQMGELIPPVILKKEHDSEEKVILPIRRENHLTRAEKVDLIRMASLASLMYKDTNDLKAVSNLFPRTLYPMSTPENLGLSLPTGLKVQAFRHGDQVIIAIRGTELRKDKSTMLFNLIADAGIGRHKTNQDLLGSIKRVNTRALSRHGFQLDGKLLSMAEKVISQRVEGHSDLSRLGSMAKRLASACGRGAKKGGLVGAVAGTLLATSAVAAGLAATPIAAGVALTVIFSSGLTGASACAVKEGFTLTTAADGYPTLLSYIQSIDDYIIALKAQKSITEKDELMTVGHSLGGYLAGVAGALHGDQIYAFNGPGVNFDEEMPELIRNMGKARSIQKLPAYHSVSMETDFIGNLTRRSGGLKKLYLPVTSKEQCLNIPPSHYDNPLAHHGIDLILQVLKICSVSKIPLIRFSQTIPSDDTQGIIII